MTYLLGVDEAGYGPNLGPLVVAASAWQVPDGLPPERLFPTLDQVIAPVGESAANRSRHGHDERLAIGDSKQLYKAGGSLALLERGVLAACELIDRRPRTWRGLWPGFDPAVAADLTAQPWHTEYDEPLPIDPASANCRIGGAALSGGMDAAGVRLAQLQARVLFPQAYNHLCERHDNKAEVLSLTSLALVRQLLEQLPAQPAIVCCDKHGGRGYYAGLLQHVFPDEPVRVHLETRELGVYELQQDGRRVEFRFLMNGERMLPTALASMTAKYLRELAMRPFNRFWQIHVPGLKATAGYAVDARRFMAEIAEAQERLKIERRMLWRER